MYTKAEKIEVSNALCPGPAFVRHFLMNSALDDTPSIDYHLVIREGYHISLDLCSACCRV